MSIIHPYSPPLGMGPFRDPVLPRVRRSAVFERFKLFLDRPES